MFPFTFFNFRISAFKRIRFCFSRNRPRRRGANFVEPLKNISAQFEKTTGNKVMVTSGATGKLYAQIKNGAPYDILLAADAKTPAKLESEDAIVPGSRFTYAIGKLALWSAKPGYVDNKGEILKKQPFNHIAIASPKLAPYGLAAQQTLEKMGLWQTMQAKIVQGENIGQTYPVRRFRQCRTRFLSPSPRSIRTAKSKAVPHGSSMQGITSRSNRSRPADPRKKQCCRCCPDEISQIRRIVQGIEILRLRPLMDN